MEDLPRALFSFSLSKPLRRKDGRVQTCGEESKTDCWKGHSIRNLILQSRLRPEKNALILHGIALLKTGRSWIVRNFQDPRTVISSPDLVLGEGEGKGEGEKEMNVDFYEEYAT